MALVQYPNAKMAISRRRAAGKRARDRIVVYFDEEGVKRYSHKMAYLRGITSAIERHLSALCAGLAIRFKVSGARVIACLFRVDTETCYTLYIPSNDVIGLVYDIAVPSSEVVLCRTTNRVYKKNYGGKEYFGKVFVSVTGERYICPVNTADASDDSVEAMIRQFLAAFYLGAESKVCIAKEVVSVLACLQRKGYYYIFAHVRPSGSGQSQTQLTTSGFIGERSE